MRIAMINLTKVNGPWTEEANAIPDLVKSLLILTFLSILTVLLQADLHIILQRLGLHIPGISGLVWISLMVAGKTKWPKGISGTYTAFALSMATLLMPTAGMGMMAGGAWSSTFLRYGISGLALDVLWPLTGNLLVWSPVYVMKVMGITALSHVGKGLFVLLSCSLSGSRFPCNPILLILLHLAFGAGAGIIGYRYGTRVPGGLWPGGKSQVF